MFPVLCKLKNIWTIYYGTWKPLHWLPGDRVTVGNKWFKWNNNSRTRQPVNKARCVRPRTYITCSQIVNFQSKKVIRIREHAPFAHRLCSKAWRMANGTVCLRSPSASVPYGNIDHGFFGAKNDKTIDKSTWASNKIWCAWVNRRFLYRHSIDTCLRPWIPRQSIEAAIYLCSGRTHLYF